MFFEYRRKISENHAGWVVYITDFTSSSLAINATSDDINPFVCVLHIGGTLCSFVYSESRTLTSRFSALIPRASCVADSSIRNKRKSHFFFLLNYVRVRNMARCHAITFFTWYIFFLFFYFFRLFFFLTLPCRKLGEMGEERERISVICSPCFCCVTKVFFFFFLSREWRIYC